MIINRSGAEFYYEGVTYRIGDPVVGTAESEYEGLYGTITEIRDGADKETENETPDIYCSFDPPMLPKEIQELEEIFSDLYGFPKMLCDICLDEVIMAPSMVKSMREVKRSLPIFVVSEDWAFRGESGKSVQFFTDYQDAHHSFHELLTKKIEHGCIFGWSGNGKLQTESGERFYKCWIDGEHCENHYRISICDETLLMSNKTYGNLGRAYGDEGYQEDVAEQVESWDDFASLTEKQQKEFVQMPGLTERIHKALGRNDSFWESYWETISEVAYAALQEYRTCLKKQEHFITNEI